MSDQQKIKVAFVANWDFVIYNFRLAWIKALINKGYDVCAVIPPGEYNDLITGEGIRIINYNIDRKSINPLKELDTINSLVKIFRREKFDIIHAFALKGSIYSSFAKPFLKKAAVINHITGLGYVYTYSDTLKRRLLRRLINLLFYMAFKVADKVVFQHADDVEVLKGLVDPSKIILIKGSGVDTGYFSRDKVDAGQIKALRQELAVTEHEVVITLIARMLWSKGIREFIEAADLLAAQNNHLRFMVIGPFDKGNPDCIPQEFIAGTHQKPYIKFIGDRRDIRELLGLTDIFAYPSFYREGIPRVILEAMSMEKPVVTTNIAGCKEAVEDGVNGLLVPVKDSRALAEAINKLVPDKNLRTQMGVLNRKRVIEEFSLEIVINHIFSLYEELRAEAQ